MSDAKKPTRKDDDAALDALVDALRAWGEFGIAMSDRSKEEIREEFEGWARHALLASPRPGIDPPDTPPSKTKDWASLSRFVREHRRGETDHIERNLTDFRQIIWSFVQGLSTALSEDRAADQSVASKLSELKRAAESEDTELLKREALASISLIQTQIRHRKQREQGQIEELSGQLERLSDELVQVKEQLSVDSLTEVWNRAGFDEHLERVVSLKAVLGQPAVLFMIDVDDFKWINDKYGHPAGDETLRRVAARLDHTFRRKGDFLCRYGGDEFAAILLEDSLETANTIGERLLHGIRNLEIEVEGVEEPIRVSISVGVARIMEGEGAAAWLDRADRALYQAKELGRDRVAIAIEASAPHTPETESE